MLKEDVPQILINRESLHHMNFDVELLGDCDIIVKELLLRLNDDNWTQLCDEIKFDSNQRLELIDDEKIIEDIISKCEDTQLPNETNPVIEVEKTFLSSFMKENTFLNLKPNIYVFHGSELRASTARKLGKNNSEDDSSEESETSTSDDDDDKTSSNCSNSDSNNSSTRSDDDKSKTDQVDESINNKNESVEQI